MWTLLLGDNGVGKTTIMRSLAMGLVDATSASALLKELYGEWVRNQAGKNGKPGTIRIEFDEKDSNGNAWYTETVFEKTGSGDTKVSQETRPEDFPWDDIFVCGYGAARRAYGTKDYDEYSAIDSLYTLFQYDAPLQNSELILRRIKDTGVKHGELLSWIDKILMLPEGSTKLNTSITVSGPWGKFMPLGSIGDGHQATLAWLLDMLGWAMSYDRDLFKKDKNKISGIVLLDEIEHHLHPSWQKKVIPLLYEQFPKLQFITTTHSVLAVIGTSSLPKEKCSLAVLEQEDDHSVIRDRLLPPYDRRADQVLTSYLFGLETTRSNDTVRKIERYTQLLSKEKRDKTEEIELKDLRSQLNKELGTPETDLQRLVEKAIHKAIEGLIAEGISTSKKPPQEAINFEIMRQLHELFDTEETHDQD